MRYANSSIDTFEAPITSTGLALGLAFEIGFAKVRDWPRLKTRLARHGASLRLELNAK